VGQDAGFVAFREFRAACGEGASVKRRVLIGTFLWTMLITLGHVQLNVGWGNLRKRAAVLTGAEREELIVGFLPVT